MSDAPDDEAWDDWDDGPDECIHEDATIDILTGEMSCHCGYHRYLSGAELEREAQIQAEAMEAYYRQCEDDERAAAHE